MKLLTVFLSSSILVACGGGGSGGPAAPTAGTPTAGTPTTGTPTTGTPTTGSSTPVTPAPAVSPARAELAKYEGTWQEKDCFDHTRFTKNFIATDSNNFSVATKNNYYDNADCTGAVIATGSYNVPDENVHYETALEASVTLLTGENITADVNRATSVYAAGATYSITGSGVKSTELIGTTMWARIEYADGGHIVIALPAALDGKTTYGALVLRNDELLALVPNVGFTNSYKVNHQYIR